MNNSNFDWNKIYEEQAGQLLGICRRYVHDGQLAEDLLHDGFIKAIENAHTFNGHGSLEGWLKKVVLNNVLEYIRNSKKNSFTDVDEVSIADEITTDSSAQALITNAHFSQQDLLEVIDLIPLHHKTVFNLYVIEGYSHKQISEVLDIEENTSKSHLLRARKKIQALLVEKTLEMKKEKDKRKKILLGLPLFTAGAKANYIDRLYKKSFSDFKLAVPNQSSTLKKIISSKKTATTLPKVGFFKSPSVIYWGVGIVTVGVIGIITYQQYTAKNKSINIQPAIETPIQNTTPLLQKDSLPQSDYKTISKPTTQEVTKSEKQTLSASTITNNTSKQEPVANNSTSVETTDIASQTDEPITIDSSKKTEPVVIRKQVVVRKQVVIDENEN